MKIQIDSASWTYRDGELYCEDVPLRLIAKKYSTPTYVYSRAHLENRFCQIDKAWRRKHLICFSLKSNTSLAVGTLLAGMGAGADVVSGGELDRAQKAGFSPERIVFAGVGKTKKEIQQALRAGILFFTVESWPEVEQINLVAKNLGVVAPIALRVTPDVDPKTHRYITTSKAENKFGLDLEGALDFYRKCQKMKQIRTIGIQMHIGSQILKVKPYLEAVKKLARLVKTLSQEGIKLDYFDIGGGMGISYQGETPPAPVQFAKSISNALKGLRLQVILEPGRSICGNAGCLLTQMVYFKQKAKKSFVILDAGMNDLIRPSLYQAYHEILPIIPGDGAKIKADVVGPICETGDTLGVNRTFPQPQAGDLFAIMSAGAYGFVMSSSYNSRPRAAEVMVSGNSFELIRKRETYRDLVRGERIPSFLQ